MGFFHKHKKLITAILAGLLALVMLLPMMANVVGIVFAADEDSLQSQLEQLRSNAGALAQQKSELNAQLKAVQKDKSKAMQKKNLVEQEINILREQLSNSESLIAQYDLLITQNEQTLVETREQEKRQYDLFCQRVRAMEEDGDISYWSILFNAASFSDLLDRFTFIGEVMEYDNGVMDHLASLRQTIAETVDLLEAERQAQQTVRAAQLAQRAELNEKYQEADDLVDEISAREDELEAAHKALDEAAKEIDRTIASKQTEYQKRITSGELKVEPGSGYLWPLEDYATLSSLFGPRIHPITRRPSNHSGIDIPAPKNTPILASRGGVVITSGWNNGGYGNYVILSHGDGTSTLYAHMNSRGCKEGDVVVQGQTIGYVGTTGRSTGNHLHFEVRIGSDRADPIDYFPDKTLYARSGGKTVKLEH